MSQLTNYAFLKGPRENLVTGCCFFNEKTIMPRLDIWV